MHPWTSAFISLVALGFTVFSFWWMNWRPASLRVGNLSNFAAGKARRSGTSEPTVIVVTLPLVIYNAGARPAVIEALRLVGTASTQIGSLACVATESQLPIRGEHEVASRDYFIFPFALKANEVIKANLVFERDAPEFSYGNLLYHLKLEAKVTGTRDWQVAKDIELDFRDDQSISSLALNIGYSCYKYGKSAA